MLTEGCGLALRETYQVLWDPTGPKLVRGYLVSQKLDLETEQVLANQKQEEVLMLDPLTGLYNKVHFTTRFEEMLSLILRAKEGLISNKGLALIFMDLDGFKNINDSVGHRAGDEVLVVVANRISQTTRPYDSFHRFGGDEFVLIVGGIDEANIQPKIGTFKADINREIVLGSDTSLRVRASFGYKYLDHPALQRLALMDKENRQEAVLALLSEADYEMYQDKKAGKNGITSAE